MLPAIAAVAGIAAVSGLINLYNAEKARGADRQRLKEIRALFEKIKPPDYDVSIDAPPQYHEQSLRQPKYSDPQQAPQFDTSRLNPEDLKLVGKYTPELAPFIAESNPELVKQSGEALKGREAQKSALKKYMEMGEAGDDAISAQESAMAQRRAGADSRSRLDSLQQSFERRGQGGAGLQMGAQLAAAQGSSDMQAQAQMQAQADAQRRRLGALASGAQLGGQLYGQEMDLAQANTGIINNFNQRMASARQNFENRRAEDLNQANRYNLGVEQDLSNRNIGARNDAAEKNLRRSDALAQYGADFRTRERNRLDEHERERYANDRGERDYRNKLAESKANWAAQSRANANKIKSQQYGDQSDWAKGMSGALGMGREGARQADIDRATATQGFANAGMSAFNSYGQGRDYNRAQASEDDRAYMQKKGSWMPKEERDKREDDYGW
jgi:hypothetical protein